MATDDDTTKRKRGPMLFAIRERDEDKALADRFRRIAKEIGRAEAQIVRDGVLRELDFIESTHPVYSPPPANHSEPSASE